MKASGFYILLSWWKFILGRDPGYLAKQRYYAKNKEICKARALAHSRSPEGKAYKVQWTRERYQKNTHWNLRKNIATRIWWAIHAKASKSAKTEELIGCSIPELKACLAKQFTNEMTWENYGTVWEIDHKIPCASFDLTQPEQQRACFHFSNLQPLLQFDNRSKGAKV